MFLNHNDLLAFALWPWADISCGLQQGPVTVCLPPGAWGRAQA